MTRPPPEKRRPLRLFWMQSGGCGGCTLSLMGAEGPDLLTTFEAANIEVLWHPSLSEESGQEVVDIMRRIVDGEETLDILCLEGSVMRGPNGTGRFHMMSGTDRPVMDWIADLAAKAGHVVAVGSCAAYGGITAAGANEVEACGLAYEGQRAGGLLGADFRSRSGMPVINVDKARTVFVLKRSMASGFAGIENPLFYKDNTRMLFGDAKESIGNLIREFS